MRETLHQLTLTLALPLSVIAVWTIRGEPARTAALEFATAYQAQLAEQPLPTRARLRAPASETAWRAPRVIPEDLAARRRRPLLPDPSAPSPVELAAEPAGSAIAIADAPSAPTEVETPGAAPREAALRRTPALAASVPGSASRRGTPISTAATASAAQGATERSDASAPAKSATESRMSRAPAQTSGSNRAATESAAAALGSESKPARIAALQAELAPAPREIAPARSPGPLSISSPAKGPAKYSPIASPAKSSPISDPAKNPAIAIGRVEGDENRGTGFGNANDHRPLTPPGLSDDRGIALAAGSDTHEPSIQLPDLPLQALATPAATHAVGPGRDLSPTAQDFGLFDAPPTTLQMIPEPGSALLLGAALAALGVARRSPRRA